MRWMFVEEFVSSFQPSLTWHIFFCRLSTVPIWWLKYLMLASIKTAPIDSSTIRHTVVRRPTRPSLRKTSAIPYNSRKPCPAPTTTFGFTTPMKRTKIGSHGACRSQQVRVDLWYLIFIGYLLATDKCIQNFIINYHVFCLHIQRQIRHRISPFRWRAAKLQQSHGVRRFKEISRHSSWKCLDYPTFSMPTRQFPSKRERFSIKWRTWLQAHRIRFTHWPFSRIKSRLHTQVVTLQQVSVLKWHWDPETKSHSTTLQRTEN